MKKRVPLLLISACVLLVAVVVGIQFKHSLFFLEQAAQFGNVEAQYTLGTMYENGQDVTRDYNEATKWYTLAAEHGHAKAQYRLGTLYSSGFRASQILV